MIDKKKLMGRLFIFFVGLPAALAVVAFLPQKNHLAANIFITALCMLGAVELAGILKKKNLLISRIEAAILGAITPAAMTLQVSFEIDSKILVPAAFTLGAAWIFVSHVFCSEKKLDNVVNYVAAGFSVVFYPSAFFGWAILMNHLPHSNYLIIAFLCIVIANDSLAWVFGILFGKNNRNFIAASPNKSIAGFVAGLAASTLVGMGIALLFPKIFMSARFAPLVSGVILGVLTGIAGMLGDLAESALKRSAGVKDSGFIIPGRGGVLDSIDSLAFAAPVYYVVYRLLFI